MATIPLRGRWHRLVAAVFGIAQLAPAVECAESCGHEGGFSLRVASGACPPTAPIQCGVGVQPRCCSPGTSCQGEGDYVGNYCCRDGSCVAQVLEKPKCPNDDWVLWGINGNLDNGGWCCLQGANGTYVNLEGGGYGVGCLAVAATTTSKGWLVASTVSTASCQASTSISTTSVEVFSTPTAAEDAEVSPGGETGDGEKSSSLSGGAVAGIVVGVVAGIGLLAGAGFLSWRRKRSQTKAIAGTYAELMGKPTEQPRWVAPVEMEVPGTVAEMDGTGVPAGYR